MTFQVALGLDLAVSALVLGYIFITDFIKYRKTKEAERNMKNSLSVTDNMLSVTDKDIIEKEKEKKVNKVTAKRATKKEKKYYQTSIEIEGFVSDFLEPEKEEKQAILDNLDKQWDEEKKEKADKPLTEMTIRELKKVAKEMKLKKYGSMKKNDLLEYIIKNIDS